MSSEQDDHELCKAAMCMKDQEIYMLRSELERQYKTIQSLSLSIERIEKTTATAIERLIRKLERRYKR
jgi:hypothetical protein